ncbi:serine--tRNA ligase [Actinophytocola xinjiangensis]|uniref:Serine--tRNA ligase n=1 Tax=Actinophytocola xinjiangensis TaxID=485602 RepID=A0A7Z0WJF4_9PSEU|nr:serine--tRNA ligase [Actinophytocola xinjiangensis]OLF08709.1 serine--tRNA ligase [Actinophytocola xinjiangensis]
MLDLTVLLDDTDDVAKRLATKGTDESVVFAARDAVLARRAARKELDDLRAEMNRRSKEVGRLMSTDPEAGKKVRAELAELKVRLTERESATREAEAHERELMLGLPNLPSPHAPVGTDEDANVILGYRGGEAVPNPGARPHWEIATELNIFDPERAAKLSGSGFSLLRGDGARLLRALTQFGLDLHRDEYEELFVPHFVREDTMIGTGHLPKFKDDAYNTTLDNLWAIPTGEVPLTALHRDEVLDSADLPLKYMTCTACFRREAGSAGKDTRGMQRLHEFQKVELVHLCLPEQLDEQFEVLLANAEKSLRALELPYRVVDLCTGDLTFSSARIHDLEVYSPGVDKWLEVSSVGSFTDFQARRSNIRYRPEAGRTAPVCTLNGSAVATPRLWAALIEHGQRPDGTVVLPEVLHPYLGKATLEANRRR